MQASVFFELMLTEFDQHQHSRDICSQFKIWTNCKNQLFDYINRPPGLINAKTRQLRFVEVFLILNLIFFTPKKINWLEINTYVDSEYL